MADEQTQEQSLGTDYYLRKGIESEYKIDAPFMKEASNYALLFKYVQIYRLVAGKYGIKGRDNIHNYMISNADRLGLPTELRTKTELSTYYTYAIQYSENGKRVATPEEVEYAKGEYEKKREEDWRDAKKKVEDHDKAIAAARVERRSLRRKSFGHLMSQIACFGIGALGLTALLTVFGGVLGGAFAGIITASMLGIGSLVGAIAYVTFGRKWLSNWWQTARAHRKNLKELRKKQNEIIAENRKEKKRKSVKAFNKVDSRRTKDAENTNDLQYLPEYTEYMQQAQHARRNVAQNTQHSAQAMQDQAREDGSISDSSERSAVQAANAAEFGGERVRTHGSNVGPEQNSEGYRAYQATGPSPVFTYPASPPYIFNTGTEQSPHPESFNSAGYVDEVIDEEVARNGSYNQNVRTYNVSETPLDNSAVEFEGEVVPVEGRSINMPRRALNSGNATETVINSVVTDSSESGVSPETAGVQTGDGQVTNNNTTSGNEIQGENMAISNYTEVEKGLIESGDKKAFVNSLKSRGFSKAQINTVWEQERNYYLDQQMKVCAQNNDKEAYNKLARERFGLFGFISRRRHWKELQAENAAAESTQTNVPPKQEGVTHTDALDAYAKKDDKDSFVSYYMAYVEPVSPSLTDLYEQSRANAERVWDTYRAKYLVNDGSVSENVPESKKDNAVSAGENVPPVTIVPGSEFVVEGFNVRQSLAWYGEQISENDKEIARLQQEFAAGQKQLEEWAKLGVVGDNIKTTTVAHMEGEGVPYFSDLSKLRELQTERKNEIARLQNENEELRRKKDGLEKDIKDGKVELEPEEQVNNDSNQVVETSTASESAPAPTQNIAVQPDKIYLDADTKKIYAFIENVDRAGFMKWAQQQGQTKDEAAKLWRLYADENFERKMNSAVRAGDRKAFDEWARKAGVTEKKRTSLWDKKQGELANGTLKPEPIFIDMEAEAAKIAEANRNSEYSNENLFKKFIAKQSKLRANPMKQGVSGSRSSENRLELFAKAVLAHQLQKHEKEQKDESTIAYVEKLIKGARNGKKAVTKKDKEFYASLVNSDALARINKFGYVEDFEEFLMYCEELRINSPEQMVKILEEQRANRQNEAESSRS